MSERWRKLAARFSEMGRGDLTPRPLEDLRWDAASAESSLEKVFAHVRADALDAIGWYRKGKRPKKRGARFIRNAALVLAGVAGILPLAAQVSSIPAPAWLSWLELGDPLWISLLLALAAGMVGFDRHLGYSSGWIRFIKTELQLRDALEAFELEWECRRATWLGNPPTPAQIDAMLVLAKTFAGQVNAILQEETNAWVEEFQTSLRQIDDAVRARAEEHRVREKAKADAEKASEAAAVPGAVNLVVKNGDRCANGWVLKVDDGEDRPFRGTTAALAGLPPGVRVFKVSGIIDGVERHGQRAATVPAGGLANEELTLS